MKIYEFGAIGSKNVNLDVETYTASNRIRRPQREDCGSVTSGGKPLGMVHGFKQGMELRKVDLRC